MYTSAGIPGTGVYAVHHIRTGEGQHHVVRGRSTGCLGALLILVAVVASLALRWWL
jgi:hypothetical protein